jgi:hypothetical protein
VHCGGAGRGCRRTLEAFECEEIKLSRAAGQRKRRSFVYSFASRRHHSERERGRENGSMREATAVSAPRRDREVTVWRREASVAMGGGGELLRHGVWIDGLTVAVPWILTYIL